MKKIHLDLQSARKDDLTKNIEVTVTASAIMSEFEMVTEAEVERTIRNGAPKSCSLNPLPTWLLMDCLPSLLPVLTKNY